MVSAIQSPLSTTPRKGSSCLLFQLHAWCRGRRGAPCWLTIIKCLIQRLAHTLQLAYQNPYPPPAWSRLSHPRIRAKMCNVAPSRESGAGYPRATMRSWRSSGACSDTSTHTALHRAMHCVHPVRWSCLAVCPKCLHLKPPPDWLAL